MDFVPHDFWGRFAHLLPSLYEFFSMALSIFPEKNFARIFTDIHGYGTNFLDYIRERNWFGLVYDNEDGDAYYLSLIHI